MLIMLGVLVPIIFWWASTGLVLFLVRRPPRTYGLTSLVAAGLAGFAALAVLASAGQATVLGAVTAYVAGLTLWGFLEITFLAGQFTGPNIDPCPDASSRWVQFGAGIMTSIYHEIAVIGFGVMLWVGLHDAVNPVAAQTFTVLWVMRWSAKLNLFFGVPNLHEGFFPAHLAHLKSYIRKRPMNGLMPISLIGGVAALAWLLRGVFAGGEAGAASNIVTLQILLVATTLFLALLEHLFLVLPVRDDRLWEWVSPDQSACVAPPAPSVSRP